MVVKRACIICGQRFAVGQKLEQHAHQAHGLKLVSKGKVNERLPPPLFDLSEYEPDPMRPLRERRSKFDHD